MQKKTLDWSIISDLVPVETEMSLCGQLLTNADRVIQAAPELRPQHFGEPVLSMIAEWCYERRAQGKSANGAQAVRALEGRVDSEAFGGMAALVGKMVAMACPSVDIPDYAAEVIEFHARRVMAEAMLDCLTDIDALSLTDIANTVQKAISKSAGSARTRWSMGDAVDAAMEVAEKAMKGELIRFVPSGMPALDNMVGGWPRSEMTIIAGRPGMGKTAFATSVALNVAQMRRAVLFISLEMPAPSITARMLSAIHFDQHARNYSADRITYQAIIQGALSDAQFEKIYDAGEVLRKLPMTIVDMPGLSISDVEIEMIRWLSECRRNSVEPGVVVIDYLQRLRPPDRYRGERVNEITEISNAIKDMAMRHDVAVVALSQLNREVERRNDKRPQASDLRDSGALEQDAHTIIMLYREAHYLEQELKAKPDDMELVSRLQEAKDRLEAVCVKNRNGPTGTVMLTARMDVNAIE